MNQRLIPLIALAILLVGCSSKEAPPVQFKELKSFQVDKRQWRSIVIAPNLEKDKLIELARYLHRSDPKTSFHIFDDDNEGEYAKLMEAEIHFGDTSYPLPEEWMRKHHIAMINMMLKGAETNPQLVAMRAGRKYADLSSVIADLK
jgi:hypothetical protein